MDNRRTTRPYHRASKSVLGVPREEPRPQSIDLCRWVFVGQAAACRSAKPVGRSKGACWGKRKAEGCVWKAGFLAACLAGDGSSVPVIRLRGEGAVAPLRVEAAPRLKWPSERNGRSAGHQGLRAPLARRGPGIDPACRRLWHPWGPVVMGELGHRTTWRAPACLRSLHADAIFAVDNLRGLLTAP